MQQVSLNLAKGASRFSGSKAPQQRAQLAQVQFGKNTGAGRSKSAGFDFCFFPSLLGCLACAIKLPMLMAACCCGVPVIAGLACAMRGFIGR